MVRPLLFKLGSWLLTLLVTLMLIVPLTAHADLINGAGGSAGVSSGKCSSGTYADKNGACKCPDGSDPDTNGTCPDAAIKCTNNQCDLVGKYLNPTINLLSAIFGTVAAMSIIIGGINFSTSEGDPQKAAKAKSRITNTIIAVVAYLFLYAFLQFLVPGGLFNR